MKVVVAGTAVLTTVGVANIEDIRTGDYVFAKDEETGQQKYMPVLETYEREVNETYTVTIEGESIETTGSHPFYTEEEGWTKAEDLKAGDKVELSDGSSGEVESVERNELEEPVTVYNFCVMDYHTYYVGESSVLVHNKCNASSAGTAAKAGGVAKTGGVAKAGQNAVSTPYGTAIQSNFKEAMQVKSYVENGGMVYRGGTLNRSKTLDAQFWAPESPLNPGYANKYGVDFSKMDYIIGGYIKKGTGFITRPAPGLGNNAGGGIEIVIPPNSITLEYFYMLGGGK